MNNVVIKKPDLFDEDLTAELVPNPNFLSDVSEADRAAWANALRSGDYRQGEGLLEGHDGSNCCLGVLQLIRGLPTKHNEDSLVGLAGLDTFGSPDKCATFNGVPAAKVEVAIVRTGEIVGEFEVAEEEGIRAYVLNDTFKCTFDEIADLIHPEGAACSS